MIGQRLLHYEIIEKLGEGGMGVVYKARDTHLDRFVAIKVLPSDKVADPARKARFRQEAKAASALNHPNIIVVHDISSDGGVDFMVMECVAGKSLDQLIPRKGMRLKDALKTAIHIADALARAHLAGIVHRDLKPSNVMLDEHGLVKVLDFGLAKLVEPQTSQEATTATIAVKTDEGTIVGTAAYMSPEQAEGRMVDARSDIFSFGALLYEMVTGRRAFQGDSKVSTLSAVLHKEPAPVGDDVPAELEKIIVRCLRKDPERRMQHMDDVKLALQDLKDESDSGATARLPRTGRRRTWMWAAIALLAVAPGAWWALRQARPDLPETSLTAVPLTSYAGSEVSPSFSPDGNQVAFAWNGEKEDNYDIYVKLIGPGTPLRLTSNPAADVSPAWSPDGRWIAFFRRLGETRAGVFLVPALGGPERKLLEIAVPPILTWERPAWHPGGEWLAFVDQDPPGSLSAVFAVSLNSGQKRRLTSPQPPLEGDKFPSFSSKGVLAFCRTVGDPADLFAVRLSATLEAQGEPWRLTFDGQPIQTPAWTPDASGIVYSAGTPGAFSLWRIGLAESGSSPHHAERLPSVGQDGLAPAFSRQGRRLAYTRSWRDLDIYRVQIPGGSPAPFISSTRDEESPQFSPDGKRIAFRSTRSGSNEIWVSDADGSNATQLTAFGGPVTADLNWSPDGRSIVFKSNVHGQGDIYVIDSGGGAPRQLNTEPSDDLMPAFSRDGQWIYFASNRSGADEIWKMPAAGGSAVQVTRHGGLFSQESPDGRFLYYGKGRGLMTSVWRMPVAGGEETRVLDSVPWWRNFAVVEDGIYFTAAGNPRSIEFLRFATGRRERVAISQKPFATGISVSPDGRTILFSVREQQGQDIMLVQNFR